MKTEIISELVYQPVLDIYQTERAIKIIKDAFQQHLSSELNLRRVTAPLLVPAGSGINDDLNGVEKPVSFAVKGLDAKVEIVQSLAKWKRLALAQYSIPESYGIYTDMNAIRPDETTDHLHSVYVDQWDWEKHIGMNDRNTEFLKKTVSKIYSALKRTEYQVYEIYPSLIPQLPDEITFVYAEELCRKYPELSPAEREKKAAKEYGAIFVIGIGAKLSDGKKHDGRAPDYDDWITPNDKGFPGLNGDIVVWNETLKSAFEISSMGIRVDSKSLYSQLAIENTLERLNMLWHQKLMNDEMPYSIGGGIGQSRLCMLLLKKKHIGEVQASVWPGHIIEKCCEEGIPLL